MTVDRSTVFYWENSLVIKLWPFSIANKLPQGNAIEYTYHNWILLLFVGVYYECYGKIHYFIVGYINGSSGAGVSTFQLRSSGIQSRGLIGITAPSFHGERDSLNGVWAT